MAASVNCLPIKWYGDAGIKSGISLAVGAFFEADIIPFICQMKVLIFVSVVIAFKTFLIYIKQTIRCHTRFMMNSWQTSTQSKCVFERKLRVKFSRVNENGNHLNEKNDDGTLCAVILLLNRPKAEHEIYINNTQFEIFISPNANEMKTSW